jgi:hypothetical protein
MLTVLKKFFSAVEGSIHGVLLPEELYRAILASLGSGSLVGLAIVVLMAIQSHVAGIFPNPTIASLAAMVLTLVLDLLRRQIHGKVPSPVTPASPDSAPSSPTV